MNPLTPYVHRLLLYCLLAVGQTVLPFTIGSISAQTYDTTRAVRVPRDDIGIVKKVTVMPYATVSYNLQSGDAFPKNAGGIGYGFGLAFDLTQDRQPLGVYVDFAYQDMRAYAANGSCGRTSEAPDAPNQSLNVTHYFSYAVAEVFLKLQSEKTNGYFLVGASFGLATTQLTVRDGAIAEDKYSDWNGLDSNFNSLGNKFRLDMRAGIGAKLGYISGHQLVLEFRLGYPLTTAISNYRDFCNGNNAEGPWRVVTVQANIGLRL